MEFWILMLVGGAVLVWLLRLFSEMPRPNTRSSSDGSRPNTSSAIDDDIVSILDPLADSAGISRSFCNVFAMLTPERRDALVSYYMERHKCGSLEAMRLAIADRQNDEERFR